jgi:hypothetical protein
VCKRDDQQNVECPVVTVRRRDTLVMFDVHGLREEYTKAQPELLVRERCMNDVVWECAANVSVAVKHILITR